MTQGLERVVAAVFLAVSVACGPVVESAEATPPSPSSALGTGGACAAGQARCFSGCKAEHTRCRTQVTVLCAAEAAVVAGCIAHACPPSVLQECTRDCAEEYAPCSSQPR
jgi:hypothetical protein